MESDVEEEEDASRDTDEAADSEAEGSGGGAQEGNDAKSTPRSGVGTLMWLPRSCIST